MTKHHPKEKTEAELELERQEAEDRAFLEAELAKQAKVEAKPEKPGKAEAKAEVVRAEQEPARFRTGGATAYEISAWREAHGTPQE